MGELQQLPMDCQSGIIRTSDIQHETDDGKTEVVPSGIF